MNLLCIFLFQSHPPISHPLCTFCNQVLHMWYMVNCLDLRPPQLCTNKNKNKNSQFKCFTNTLRHYPSPCQRRSYLCSLSCHWSESILYILNGQKEHTRAFFVWTACMWESIPILELFWGNVTVPTLVHFRSAPHTNVDGLFNKLP